MKQQGLDPDSFQNGPWYMKNGAQIDQNNPLPWQKYVDSQTTNVPNQIMQDVTGVDGSRQTSFGDPSQWGKAETGRLLNGVGNENLIHSQSPMSEAIAKKYQQRAQQSLNSLKTNIQADQPMRAAKQIEFAGRVNNSIEQNKLNNYKEAWSFQIQRDAAYKKWNDAKKAAEQQFLSTVLGIPFMVAGGIAGGMLGGPAGAMMGASAGGAIGGGVGMLAGGN